MTAHDARTAAVVQRLHAHRIYDLVLRVARRRHVTAALICGRGRTAGVVAARHDAWLEIYGRVGMSTREMGGIFDVGHKGIGHGIREAQARARAGRVGRAARTEEELAMAGQIADVLEGRSAGEHGAARSLDLIASIVGWRPGMRRRAG